MIDTLLRTLAHAAAKSTIVTGYRGIGRIFGPLSRFPRLRQVPATRRLRNGRLITFPAFDYYWSPHLWTGKEYEPDVRKIFDALAKQPNKVFVDCGANIGYWTVLLSDPAYNFSRLYAIEANPYVYGYAARNVEINKIECILVNRAISDRTGEILHLSGSDTHAAGSVGTGQGPAVETISLPDLLRSGPPLASDALIVVKLDVEGLEIATMKGAAAGMPDADFLYVYEDWPAVGRDMATSMTGTRHLLAYGFEVVGLSNDGRFFKVASVEEAMDFNRRNTTQHEPTNFIGCRDAGRFFPLS